MSESDVDSNEMNSPHDFDDAATEAILAGNGADIDPRLAELIGDMRVAYTSRPTLMSAELAALLTPNPAVATASSPRSSRRFERTRSSTLAKIGAAAAALMAATGGLAAANALPAPMQEVLSHLGVGAPVKHDHTSVAFAPTTPSVSTTTVDSTSTTMPHDSHGKIVSTVARDHSDGCDHGANVSQVASGGRTNNGSNGRPPSRPCETTTTVAGAGATPTMVHNNGHDAADSHNNGHGTSQSGHDTTSSTTIAGETTPTTAHQANGHDHGGSSGGGS
jgi:hypothetical protein